MSDRLTTAISPDSTTVRLLLEIARQYGTPTYAYDVRRLRRQASKLRQYLPDSVGIFYSLKANASLGICDVFSDLGLGADVASAGELATAVEAGFAGDRLFVAGPFKSPETIAQLRDLPEAIVSIDSPSELRWLAKEKVANPAVLRLRPDFGSHAVVTAGAESRFGFSEQDLLGCRDEIASHGEFIKGFHVFAGSQVLQADGVLEHLRGTVRVSQRAAEIVGIKPELLNLGGGFGIPYGPDDQELDLGPISAELERLVAEVAPARILIELGRYLVAQAGWYLTTVMGYQTHQGRPAVLVDGGTHQRADLCGLGLRNKANPPAALNAERRPPVATDVLGSLSLPEDVLVESSLLPPLRPGDVLAFANAGAYGLWASATVFHGNTLPAEVAFDDEGVHLMRARQPARSILVGQLHVNQPRPTLCDSTR